MSTPQSRDRALEHLLRRRVSVSGETPACTDAETLAAWVDGGLDAQAMAETELHLSNCARCQAMLAAIVRSEPEAPAVDPWWSRMRLRWLVPLTAAAAATALWMVVPGPGSDAPTTAPETIQARVERDAPAAAAEPSVVPQEKADRTRPPTASPSAAPASPAPPAHAGKDAGETARPTDERRADTAVSDQARPGAAAAEPPREEAPAERQALAKQQSADSLARSGMPPAAEAPQTVKPIPPPTAPTAGAAGAVAGFGGTGAPAVPSFDGVARWRLASTGPADLEARPGLDGMVDRSDDGGATWHRVSTGLPRRFTAGYAPSASVCWLVGPGGTVALTIDARSWRQLSMPAPDADLVSVQASDARTATVRDAQGRLFRTVDGGATWTRLP